MTGSIWELGEIPIRFIVKERRLNFLWYILHEDKDSLINMCLTKQLESPGHGDWGQSCKKTLKEFDLDLSIADIEKIKEEQLRSLVRTKIEENTLEYLNKLKSKYSKVMNILHPKLVMQTYLEANELTTYESKFPSTLRSRMLEVKVNYREKYFLNTCPCCLMEEDTQEHLLYCYILEEEGLLVDNNINYEDIFGSNLERQVNKSRIIKTKFKLRKRIENHST